MATKASTIKREVRKDVKQALPPAAKREVKRENKKKSKKALNKESVSKYLAGINPYAMSIADPFGVRGVRIPDAITTPSSTFSLTYRGTITAAAGDVSSCVMLGASTLSDDANMSKVGLIPLPNSTVATLAYRAGSFYNSTTSSFVTGVSTTTTGLQFPDWSSGSPTIKNLYSMVRLVSCGLAINYTGAPLNASGVLTAVSVPVQTLRNTFNTTWSVAQLQNLPGASISPINDFKGAMARYIPFDMSSTEYVQTDVDSNSTAAIDAVDIERHCPGALIIALSGMPAGAWSYQLSVVANYEGVPRAASTNFVSTETSKSDPLAMSHASNVVEGLSGSLPTAAPATVSPPAAGSKGSADSDGLAIHEEVTARTPQHAETLNKVDDNPLGFMGSLMDGLGDIGSIVGKVAPLALALL